MVIIPGTGMYLGVMGADGESDILPGKAVFLNQIHSSKIIVNPVGGESADGMIMNRGFQVHVPALRVADCLPVFALWDDYAGAAHAGWRGIAGGIIENLINAVDQPLRWLILGPCICHKCYVVGDDVREAVLSGDPAGGDGHPGNRIDLRGTALRRAKQQCREHFKVFSIDKCTLESRSLYSFRENETSDRNLLWLAQIERCEHIPQLNTESECYSLERRKN